MQLFYMNSSVCNIFWINFTQLVIILILKLKDKISVKSKFQA